MNKAAIYELRARDSMVKQKGSGANQSPFQRRRAAPMYKQAGLNTFAASRQARLTVEVKNEPRLCAT